MQHMSFKFFSSVINLRWQSYSLKVQQEKGILFFAQFKVKGDVESKKSSNYI